MKGKLIAALLSTLLMFGCGGAEESSEQATQFAGRMYAAGVTPVAQQVATTVTSEMVLDWAEYKFPELFPKALGEHFPNIEYLGVIYNARAYSGAWGTRYLGITPDGKIYGLGDFTGDALQQFDDVNHWSSQILSDRCNVYAQSCLNTAPVANIYQLEDVSSGTVVTLDGSGSSDADGDQLTYKWSIKSKPLGSNASLSSSFTAKPTFTADREGTYELTLVVSDRSLSSEMATILVTAKPRAPAPAPTAFTFDEPVPPRLIGFAGAESSTVTVEPGNAANRVVRVDRSANALFYAGTVVGTASDGTLGPIAFAPGRTALTLRVWSPEAGINVLLKVENADGSKTVATQARVTTAGTWQSLSFDFAEPLDALPVLDFRVPYVKIVVFINFGKTGAEAGAKTYYFDDLSFTPVAAPPAQGRVSDGVARRALPPSYSQGKAVAYGYVRATALTDADLLQDLALMDAAGFNLVRTYVADAITQRLFTLAATAYPQMRFQLGASIGGAVCDSSSNQSQRDNAIAQARAHANVVAVSVANEAWQLSASCLAGYAAAIRSQVTQPITYNDISIFWTGGWTNGLPDPLLSVIDFASLHIYPFLELDGWDWRQAAVPAGPQRAASMMEESLVYLKALHAWTGRAAFRSASGATAHLAASMPVIIGETGWKARQTNPSNAIEAHAANSVNQKWYVDLLRRWELSEGGPKVFQFVAFDEAWKGTDDGWGQWNDGRQPRYSLCGLAVPFAPACNADVYSGAGYFN